MKNFYVAIGHKIKERRQLLDMSQRDLSKKLGVSHQQIQKYETGKNKMLVSRLVEISMHLDCDIYYFLHSNKDDVLTGDAIELLKYYNKISDKKKRQVLINLVREMV